MRSRLILKGVVRKLILWNSQICIRRSRILIYKVLDHESIWNWMNRLTQRIYWILMRKILWMKISISLQTFLKAAREARKIHRMISKGVMVCLLNSKIFIFRKKIVEKFIIQYRLLSYIRMTSKTKNAFLNLKLLTTAKLTSKKCNLLTKCLNRNQVNSRRRLRVKGRF